MPTDLTTDQLAHLLALNRALLTEQLFDDLVLQLNQAAVALTHAEAAFTLVLDDFDQTLHFVGLTNAQSRLSGRPLRLAGSAAGQVLRSLKPIIQHGPATTAIADLSLLTDLHLHSFVGLPIHVNGRPAGVLEVVNKAEKQPFTANDHAVLEQLCVLLGIAIDRQRLQTRLARTTREVEELDRVKRTFTAIVQHELRTPLGLILGYSSFLREMVEEDMQGQFDVILKAANRLKEITEDLTSIAHIDLQEHRFQRQALLVSDLMEVLTERNLPAVTARQQTLRCQPSEQPLFIYADAEKIADAINAIIGNAIQFTPEGGEITFTAEDADDDRVRILVKDSGIGIAPEEHERIFERFYQVDSPLTRSHGGMGLGLSIARAIVEAHNGTITVESTPGQGSTFSLYVPKPRGT